HHKNLWVPYLTRTCSTARNKTARCLNTHYLVLFKNARDATQISHLTAQMHPGKLTFLIEAYRDATSQPFSYLLIDLKPDTDDKLRVRSNNFPDETPYVYVPK